MISRKLRRKAKLKEIARVQSWQQFLGPTMKPRLKMSEKEANKRLNQVFGAANAGLGPRPVQYPKSKARIKLSGRIFRSGSNFTYELVEVTYSAVDRQQKINEITTTRPAPDPAVAFFLAVTDLALRYETPRPLDDLSDVLPRTSPSRVKIRDAYKDV